MLGQVASLVAALEKRLLLSRHLPKETRPKEHLPPFEGEQPQSIAVQVRLSLQRHCPQIDVQSRSEQRNPNSNTGTALVRRYLWIDARSLMPAAYKCLYRSCKVQERSRIERADRVRRGRLPPASQES